MASGFSGGGAPDFFTGRSIPSNPSMSNQQHPQHPQLPYRSQLPGLFLDQSAQIARQQALPSVIGKRTLSEFRNPAQFQNQMGLNGLLLRSVKPRRTYNHTSPISPLSPIDFSSPPTTTTSPDMSSLLLSPQQQQQQQQHNNNTVRRPAVLEQQQQQQQQLQSQPISSMGNATIIQQYSNSNSATLPLPEVPYMDTTTTPTNTVAPNKVLSSAQDLSDEKMMLRYLEKRLLDDDDDVNDESDDASVITKSGWSETIQSLISPTQKPISTSPTSSTSSCTSSVASPGSTCLKQSLMEAATSICEGKNDAAVEILTRLSQVSLNPKGNSEERLMSHMVATMKSRANPLVNPPPVAELFSKEHADSTQLLYEMSPCFKLGFMAANLAILEATIDEKSDNGNKIHVIDFDVGQGDQYVHLLHALSARQNGKPFAVKITAVADHKGGEERLGTVGKMLSQHAKQFGVSFIFKVVDSPKLGELTRESLGCDSDEPLAVNFAFKLCRMPDESVSTDNPRDELLRRVKGLGPRVVTLVEQQMNTNTAPFMARVTETCAYYGALFDSIEATVARDRADRGKVEEGLGRRLANSVACEGRDRVERCEVFGKWRARMGMAGFELRQLSQNVAETMKTRLSAGGNRVNPGFTVSEENGGVCFGWMGRTLTVASAWR
ncbi:Scarecrow-like protein 8 [Morella rubra]|uniref:Scarecrow-like protein 8 n=1 Tax=Morella rubra TaxID=262757 RepID=A0A6A1UYI4_9ROSI|nr:Scarecrow-like protein 8 [Morella rubra]